MTLTKEEKQEIIAKRAALEIPDGSLINLGIGLPTKVANYISDDLDITLQSENGFVGLEIGGDDAREHTVNAGGQAVSIKKGGAFFDSTESFGIIRGGLVDATILGALQVDQQGNIANYMIPGKMVPGMGGAMDLVVGARKVIVAMEHTNKGTHKILENCTLPLTAEKAVDVIITEMGVFEITEEGIAITELNDNFTLEEVQEATEPKLIDARK